MATAKPKRPTTKLPDITPDEASRIIKKFAAKQKITVQLTQEQVDAILAKWNEGDPQLPAEITFRVGRKKIIDLKVAGYRYRGDTCCA
jgi:hypothetical protein